METIDSMPGWKKELILRRRQVRNHNNRVSSSPLDELQKRESGSAKVAGGGSRQKSVEEAKTNLSNERFGDVRGGSCEWSLKAMVQQQESMSESGVLGLGLGCEDLEDLRYGPGIVSRLKHRYMSLAQRAVLSKTRPPLLRNATSFEHLLDAQAEEDIHIQKSQKLFETRIFNGATAVNPNGGNRYKKAHGDLKRTRSEEAISSAIYAEPAPKTDELANSKTKSNGRCCNRPLRLHPVLSEKEKPPANFVKQTKMLYERQAPLCANNKGPVVANKVAAFKSLSQPKKRAGVARQKPVLKKYQSVSVSNPSPMPDLLLSSPARKDVEALNSANTAQNCKVAVDDDVPKIISKQSQENIGKAGLSVTFDFSQLAQKRLQKPTVNHNNHPPFVPNSPATVISPITSPTARTFPAPLPSPIPPDTVNSSTTTPAIPASPTINSPAPLISPTIRTFPAPLPAPIPPETITSSTTISSPVSVISPVISPTSRTFPAPPVPHSVPTITSPTVLKRPAPEVPVRTAVAKENGFPAAAVKEELLKKSKAKKKGLEADEEVVKCVETVNVAVRNGESGRIDVPKKRAPQRPDCPNSVVFKFTDRRDVPDYVSNDGRVQVQKVEKPKVGDGGIILLPGASLNDLEDDLMSLLECPPSPCDVEFVNDSVIINGRSSIISKDNSRKKLSISFSKEVVDHVFEYPSEDSLLEDDSGSAVQQQQVQQSPTTVGQVVPQLSGSCLGSYTPKSGRNPEEFQLGVTKTANIVPEKGDQSEESLVEQEQPVVFSAGTNEDILF